VSPPSIARRHARACGRRGYTHESSSGHIRDRGRAAEGVVDGTTNPTCAAKVFPLSNGFTWEPDTDRSLTSELILYDLTVTPKGN
jgi:hypothetical protein